MIKLTINNARNRFNRHKTDLNRNYLSRSMYNNTKRKAMNKLKMKKGKRISNLAKKRP